MAGKNQFPKFDGGNSENFLMEEKFEERPGMIKNATPNFFSLETC